MISLERRLTLLMLALLCLCWAVAGFTVYGLLRRAQEMELDRRLDIRLAWLGAAVSVSNVEGGQIKLHRRPEPDDAARSWRVTTHDGKVLWASEGRGVSRSPHGRSAVLVFGDRSLPPLEGRSIVPREEVVWAGVPRAVREAAERTVPGLVVDEVSRSPADGRGRVVFTIDGRGESRECLLAIDGSGRVLSDVTGKEIDLESSSVQPRYRLTGKPGRIELRLSAWTSAAAMEQQLARLAWGLRTAGPLTLLLTGVMVAALIRWQLRPLSRMAEEASRIGPGSSAGRIGPVGSSAECVQLREAINGMLDRLAEGLEREHRFASTAAHELRTPLAQLRTTIEVALRRERDAPEYRSALLETLADVDRLEKLVLGLLHLARGAEPAGMTPGQPVALASLLERAGRDHGPFTAERGTNGDDVTIEGDEGLFLAALGNVLENAAHYAPGAWAAVRVEDEDEDEEAGGVVRLVVADRGPGVAEADRERIFQPLTRLEAARTHDGFGLGLTVARAAARAYGGDLVCRGRADGAPGAEFVFLFRKAAARD